MELEALGGISGEVLDIGCGLGDNTIYLASRGYSVTALDGSPAAIEEARDRGRPKRASGDVRRRRRHRPDRIRRPVRHGDRQRAVALPRRGRPARLRRRPVPRDPARCALVYLVLLRRQRQRRHRADGSGAGGQHPRHPDGQRLAHRLPRPHHLSGQRRGFGGREDAVREAMEERCRPRRSSRCGRSRTVHQVAELLDGDRIHLPFTVVHATASTDSRPHSAPPAR